MNIESMNMSRRDLMKLTAASAIVAGTSKIWPAPTVTPRIGVQLYSVRRDCKKDFDKTLEEVAKLGFVGVEFAGYFKYSGKAKELKKRLDDLGLVAAGTHIRPHREKGDALKRMIEFHKTIGCKYLICPGDKDFCHPEKSKALAEMFNKTAEALKPAGMYCGYHNHTKEFKKVDGRCYWDLFAERTSKDVVLQQDVGWTTHAGLNPAKFIKKYPGRTKTTHFKPTAMGGGTQPILGQDSVKWKEIIEACYSIGGTEWMIVEQERYIKGKTPMECTALSLKGLKTILKEMGK